MNQRSLHRALPSSLARHRGMWVVLLLQIVLVSEVSGQKSRPYYHEDLYSLRPKLAEPIDSLAQREKLGEKHFVAATANVNEKVDDVLDSINRFNITRKFIEGYTIQIYSGQNREEAMNAKKKMSEAGLNGALEYTQPKFRVRYGNYYSRLEAQKDLTRLKKSFPNAILVPEKILVR